METIWRSDPTFFFFSFSLSSYSFLSLPLFLLILTGVSPRFRGQEPCRPMARHPLLDPPAEGWAEVVGAHAHAGRSKDVWEVD